MTSSADSDKVQAAVKVLIRAPTLSVPEAMRVARISDTEIADHSLRRRVRRALPGGTRKGLRALAVRVSASVIGRNINEPIFVTPGPAVLYDDIIIPRPVLTKTRLGSSAKQQQRENDCRLREHKSKALKAATMSVLLPRLAPQLKPCDFITKDTYTTWLGEQLSWIDVMSEI